MQTNEGTKTLDPLGLGLQEPGFQFQGEKKKKRSGGMGRDILSSREVSLEAQPLSLESLS